MKLAIMPSSSMLLMALFPTLRQRHSISSCIPLNALSPSLMDPIIQHPAISALSIDIRPRSRLKEKHKYLFDRRSRNIDDENNITNTNTNKNKNNSKILSLFDELALVACSTGVVCRKELLETYAAAIFIHAKFPHMKRMADLAAGHGLLSWFLLALDHYECDDSDEDNDNDTGDNINVKSQPRPRTVVCVDRRMPQSADVIASAMIERFPELEERWSYVQSDLSAVVPHSSCVLISVHACGTLTDYLIEMAIGTGIHASGGDHQNGTITGAPLAIVPCCHTVKKRKGYRPHFLSGMEAEEVAALVEERKKTQEYAKHEAVADVVDEVRCQTLRNAGYNVEEVMLPESFTGRNRVLLGEVSSTLSSTGAFVAMSQEENDIPIKVGAGIPNNMIFFERKRGKRETAPPSIRIPLADDEESIAHCHAISGRERATKRLIQQIPKHFSPSLVMSIWLTDAHTGEKRSSDVSILTIEVLQEFADQCCKEFESQKIQCTVEIFGEVNVQSTTGRRSQLYRFTYKTPEGTDISIANVSRATAKILDGVIRERIIDKFGNILR